jgi:glutamyl-tRNA reductase
VLDTLTAVHRPRGRDGSDLARDQPRAVIFRTCLRQIGFLRSGELEPLGSADEVYTGEPLYRFLLEVICGLRSPLLGETEVLGQFKEFSLTSQATQASWGAFRQLLTQLLTDAKAVRSAHLRNLGGRSYGSLARRHVRGCRSVVILGSGQLARELLPCLMKVEHLEIVCRSKRRAARLKRDFPQVELRQLTEAAATDAAGPRALVVAAPMGARAIRNWILRQQYVFDRIVDLRGESSRDPLSLSTGDAHLTDIVSLPALMAELESQRLDADARVAEAREEIRRRARACAEREEIHPFGWEDLCA